jgi:hypothetical protein
MISFKDFLNLDEILHRFDAKLIRSPQTNFSTNQNTYYNTPDHSESGPYPNSGRRPSRVRNKVSTATYAALPQQAARYAAPRDVPHVTHIDPESGHRIITFEKSAEEHIKKHRPVLSVWNDRDAHKAKFKNTTGAEFRSDTPGRPTSQRIISDPIRHLEKHGYKINFVDDIEDHAKELHKKGIDYEADDVQFKP